MRHERLLHIYIYIYIVFLTVIENTVCRRMSLEIMKYWIATISRWTYDFFFPACNVYVLRTERIVGSDKRINDIVKYLKDDDVVEKVFLT